MRRIAIGLWVVLQAGCVPAFVCDEFPTRDECAVPELRCAVTGTAETNPRIDVSQPFSIYAKGLRRSVLGTQAANLDAKLTLEFLDGGSAANTGELQATTLVPARDDELRLQLTPAAMLALTPRRGGMARIQVDLGRWRGAALSGDDARRGCAFVLEPRYDITAGHRFDAQRTGLRSLGARLFAGRRLDCTGVADPACNRSAALYASYYEGEPATRCLQLEQFVVDAKTGLLRSAPSLPLAFRGLRPDDRLQSQNASVVALASQLLVRSSSKRLVSISATTFGPQNLLDTPPVPEHGALSGSFEQDRFFLRLAAGGVQDFTLPAGASTATPGRPSPWPTLAPPYRLFERAQRPWAAAPQPDLLALSDQGEVQLLCEDGLTDTCKTLEMSARTKLTGLYSNLDALLADMDADGLQDIVSLNRTTKVVSWLPQFRDGGFGDAKPLAGVPSTEAFAIADFDGDGLLDIAVLAAGSELGGSELSVLINQALPQPTKP